MNIEYRIELNPHATKANEYMILAFNSDYPDYSYVSFFDLTDKDIVIYWLDWGSLDCGECSEDYIENFNSSIHAGEAKLLIEKFIDEYIAENKKTSKVKSA